MLFKDYLEQINKYAKEHPETLDYKMLNLDDGFYDELGDNFDNLIIDLGMYDNKYRDLKKLDQGYEEDIIIDSICIY
jgi:hypothetical protein